MAYKSIKNYLEVKTDGMARLGQRLIEYENPKYMIPAKPMPEHEIKIPWYLRQGVRQVLNVVTTLAGGILLIIPQTRAIATPLVTALTMKKKSNGNGLMALLKKILKAISDYLTQKGK